MDKVTPKHYNIRSMFRRAGKTDHSAEHSKERVLTHMMNERQTSRPHLAEMTGLSRATIALIVDEFLDKGLVTEIGPGNSSGGRPPVLLEFNADAALALGASIHGNEWSIVATNLDARMVFRQREPMRDSSVEAAIEALSRGVARVRKEVDSRKLLPGIGIGSPGLVDIYSGTVKSAVDMDWLNVPMGELVEAATGVKAFVANRSKVGALAELRLSPDRSVQDLIYVSVGTGVAAGIIQEGRLLIGTNSSAGELGHITIVPSGPLCACGNRGCLQELVSERAIANRARMRIREQNQTSLRRIAGALPETLGAHDVLKAAEEGDAVARSVLEEVAGYLSIALGNLINLFNPQLVVLGGPVATESPYLCEQVVTQVALHAMAYPLSATQIKQSSLGIDASAIGASVLVLQRASDLVAALDR